MTVRLLVLLHAGGDLDALAPVVERVRDDPAFTVAACVTTKFLRRTPDVRARLAALGCPTTTLSPFAFQWLRRPALGGVDALLTATESSLPVHRIAHALTRRADARGVRTYTMQQGLENVGLSYFDQRHDATVGFAARRIFTWGPVENLPAELPAATRARCVAVGATKPFSTPDARPAPGGGGRRPLAAVFENLHWGRYSDAYRRGFFDSLRAMAAASPDWDVVLKPHPKSTWSASPLAAGLPANVRLAASASRESGPNLAASADRVITTPSTIALDAARAGTPVAVAGFDLELSYYRPLDVLESPSDWTAFLTGPDQPAATREAFLARVLLPGDAVGRILAQLRSDARPNR